MVSIYVPLQNSYDTNSNESSPTQNIIISEQDRICAIPTWVIEPSNITVNYGEWVSFQLNASSTFGDLYYWISDTVNFAIDYGTGYVWNRFLLAPGTYPIFIAVFDITYTKLSKWIYIFVLDPESPIVEGPDDMTFAEGEASGNLTWDIFDHAPDKYEITKDETRIQWDLWLEANETVSIEFNNLAVGVHIYTLEVMDTSGNTAPHSVTIEVISDETIPSTTDLSPSDTDTTRGGTDMPSSQIQTEMFFLLIIGLSAIASIGGIVALAQHRKSTS
ncbi:MAG: hypothetical protein ACTSQZ_04570 [Candidatus Thorarchaeota archaeon]